MMEEMVDASVRRLGARVDVAAGLSAQCTRLEGRRARAWQRAKPGWEANNQRGEETVSLGDWNGHLSSSGRLALHTMKEMACAPSRAAVRPQTLLQVFEPFFIMAEHPGFTRNSPRR